MAAVPVLAMRPSAAANDDGEITIATSKEWVLPPKPRPGRKPTPDSAPTKRKAQNRDAQRAFRERRAARVGELEQQIRDIEADHRAALEVVELDRSRLGLENRRLRETVDGLMRELNTIRSLTNLSQPPTHTSNAPDMTPTTYNPFQVQQTASPAPSTEGHRSPSHFSHVTDHNMGKSVPLKRRSKRKSQSTGSDLLDSSKKRLHSEADFYNSPGSEVRSRSTSEFLFDNDANFAPFAGESCGFCSDGTPCLCADAAQEHASSLLQRDGSSAISETGLNVDRPGTCVMCTQTTPCLCVEVENASKQQKKFAILPTIVEEDNGLCTGDPGSCRQCQLDPMSTLFCKSLASTVSSRTEEAQRPTLVHRSSSFSISSARESTPPLPPSESNAYVPCSAAYQSLSRHSNFGTSDLGTLVAGLRVDTNKGRGVEVESVRDVLRILDRGLGRDT